MVSAASMGSGGLNAVAQTADISRVTIAADPQELGRRRCRPRYRPGRDQWFACPVCERQRRCPARDRVVQSVRVSRHHIGCASSVTRSILSPLSRNCCRIVVDGVSRFVIESASSSEAGTERDQAWRRDLMTSRAFILFIIHVSAVDHDNRPARRRCSDDATHAVPFRWR